MRELQPEELRRKSNVFSLGFKTTKEVEPLEGFVSQPRLMQALTMGLIAHDKAYNIRVVSNGIVRASHSVLASAARDIARGAPWRREANHDYLYAHNAQDFNRPMPIILPAGNGTKFQEDLRAFGRALRIEIPRAFGSTEYNREIDAINKWAQELQVAQKEELDAMSSQFGGAKNGVVLRRIAPQRWPGDMSVLILPHFMDYKDLIAKKSIGESLGWEENELVPIFAVPQKPPEYYVIAPESVDKWLSSRGLSKEEKVKLAYAIKGLEKKFGEEIAAAYLKTEEASKAAHDRFIGGAFDSAAGRMFEKYPESKDLLDSLRDFVVSDSGAFMPGQHGDAPGTREDGMSLSEIFEANLLVDNSRLGEEVPVIVERNPTFRNVFGGIIRSALATQHGYSFSQTNHISIEAGSLWRANNGVYIFDLKDMAMTPELLYTLRTLAKCIRSGEISPEDLAERNPFFMPTHFRPKAIPFKAKVIVLTDNNLDHAFSAIFPEERDLFRVRAEVAAFGEWNDDIELKFAQFLRSAGEANNLPCADAGAVGAILENASRFVEDNRKVSLNFTRIKDVYLQGVYWARARDPNAELVTGEDIEKAICENEYRMSSVRDRVLEFQNTGVLKIYLDGRRTGRVNGLAVNFAGEMKFGRPIAISASVVPGGYGISHMEEGDLSMKKSVKIIESYIGRKYGRKRKMSARGQIIFEQIYAELGGDSASLAEFAAFISALADLPVRQDLAVTGSANQDGEVQAIGGVNEKIEGFFDACRTTSLLTGKQGVVIPKDNLRHLMLRPDVVEAVEKGEFHVWAVSTIEEAAEILLDMSSAEIDRAVVRELKAFDKMLKPKPKKNKNGKNGKNSKNSRAVK